MNDTLVNVICSLMVGLSYKYLYAFVAACLKKLLS